MQHEAVSPPSPSSEVISRFLTWLENLRLAVTLEAQQLPEELEIGG